MTEENKPPTTTEVVEEMKDEHGLLFTMLTKLIGWALFLAFIAFIIGTAIFVSLALYRGIVWAWPGGAPA